MDTGRLSSLSRSSIANLRESFALAPECASPALCSAPLLEIELAQRVYEPAALSRIARALPIVEVYNEFVRRHRATIASREPAMRVAFLQFYNEHIAPKLHTEEAAFQLLTSRVVNLYLEEGYTIDFAIERNLEGEPVDRYARRYRVGKPIIDLHRGLVMHTLLPDDPSKDVIFAFPGTAGFSRRDVLCAQNLPTGRQADMDRTGVGRRAFEANEVCITERIEGVILAGQNVSLLGFSLGGAYAARAMAALPERLQAHCQLRSFFAPGLDAETGGRVAPGYDNVTSVYHAYDVVCAAGDMHLPGKSIRITDMILCKRQKQTPHSIPQLAVRELMGQTPQFTVSTQARSRNPVVEGVRKTLARFVEKWVLP